jgi:glycosyltransferase involved in cell wall biosynthesis
MSLTTSLPHARQQTATANAPTLSVSVLVPVFNEESTVRTILQRVLSLDINLLEIVVVDDGSTDGTEAAVRAVADQDRRVRLFQLERNQGKTAAVRCALDQARGDLIVIQDADLEYDPSEIPALLAPIIEGKADVVYGSRFLVRRASRVLYFYHTLANRGLTFLSNLFTNRNMTDIETGYKAFRAEVIKPLKFRSRGFGMEVEITALVCKTLARTYEVPISYYGRTYEEGKKIGFRDGVAAAFYVIYFNTVAPRTGAGRQYINTVNRLLTA